MDILGIQKDLDTTRAALNQALDRIAQLETQTAKDVDAIASKVIGGLSPLVKEATDAINTVALTVNATATIAQNVIRRLDGATATLKLGPEIPE
jgi:hypothetical protein